MKRYINIKMILVLLFFIDTIHYQYGMGVSFDMGINQNPATREFRGYFANNRDMYRIQISYQDTTVTGFVQIEGYANPIKLGGKINNKLEFVIFELDEFEERTANKYAGIIKDTIMQGTYYTLKNKKDFEFLEINLKHPPEFKSINVKDKVLFKDYISNFRRIALPSKLYYDTLAPAIVDLIGFMDKPIRRIGSYTEPITLMDRSSILKALSKRGKVILDGGNIGMLIQAYFNEWVDGPMFGVYFYVYNAKGEYIDAFVIYEAIIPGYPTMTTKLSGSCIFSLEESGETYEFKINEDGSISFREHDY